MTNQEKYEELVWEALTSQVEEMGEGYELADYPLHFRENGIFHQILSYCPTFKEYSHEGNARLTSEQLEALKKEAGLN